MQTTLLVTWFIQQSGNKGNQLLQGSQTQQKAVPQSSPCHFLLACHFIYLSYHNSEVISPPLHMSSGCRCLIKCRDNFTFNFYSGSSFLEVTSRFIGNFSRPAHPQNILRRNFRIIPAIQHCYSCGNQDLVSLFAMFQFASVKNTLLKWRNEVQVSWLLCPT